MTILKSELASPRSIPDVILSADIHPLRKWLLRKLIPQSLWAAPAMQIAQLQKGAVIGHVVIHLNETGETLDIGASGK